MASGSPVVQILQVMPPNTLSATPDTRVGGSTPAELFDVWDFDAAADEYLDFLCALRGYGGGGLTFTIVWMASTATTGVTRWGIAIRRLQDDTEDIDTSQTYDFNDVDATTASATGEQAYDTITFTNGADMDSVADGEFFILRLRRGGSHANDTLSGDAEFCGFIGKET